jgi:hypothetical protein
MNMAATITSTIGRIIACRRNNKTPATSKQIPVTESMSLFEKERLILIGMMISAEFTGKG